MMKLKTLIVALMHAPLLLGTYATANEEEVQTQALIYKSQGQDGGFTFAFLIQPAAKSALFLSCDMNPDFQSGTPTEVKNYISTKCHDFSDLPKDVALKLFFQTKANRFVMSFTENAIKIQSPPLLASTASMLVVNMNDLATATLTYAMTIQPSEENTKIESNRFTFLKLSDAVIPYRRLNNETVIVP